MDRDRILIVDDDAAIREMLEVVLQVCGYEVDSAGNGAEALARLRSPSQDPPDLILLDLMMPEMNGWQFRAEQARDSALADIPVVLMTATTGEMSLSDPFIRKPFNQNDLLRVLESTLARHRRRGQPRALRARVLVVDDDPLLGPSLLRALKHTHEVVLAPSACEALAWLAAGNRLDVILCDANMTGIELHGEIVRRYPRLAERVIFMTGGAPVPAAAEQIARAGNPCLGKPVDLGVLAPLIDKWVSHS
jgi:CheY-like chemotaxis protein